MTINVAKLIVDKIKQYNIKKIFTVPGASIDKLLNELKNEKEIEVVVCHHESTAGYMAIGYAKVTNNPAILLVTAGPGASNAATAIATAFSEMVPLICISGQMHSRTTFKIGHQVIDAEMMFKPISKWSYNLINPNTISGVFDQAYSYSTTNRKGPVHISISADLFDSEIEYSSTNFKYKKNINLIDKNEVKRAAKLISEAKNPLFIIGGKGATVKTVPFINNIAKKFNIAVACTFEGAGTIQKENLDFFIGRIGVFPNCPAHKLIEKSDLIILVGYNIAEVDPIFWNKNDAPIIDISESVASYDFGYHTISECYGNIENSLEELEQHLTFKASTNYLNTIKEIRMDLTKRMHTYEKVQNLVHPLEVIEELNHLIKGEGILITDVGSHQYWLSEYYYSYKPATFLSSMGFQTMGVSIPFAIGASLATNKKQKIYSVSGDGSFLMCLMEIETALREKLPIVHMIFKDNAFDLVKIQQLKKYNQFSSASFDDIDYAKIAEGFGAKTYKVNSKEQLHKALEESKNINKFILIEIAINYNDNQKLVRI